MTNTKKTGGRLHDKTKRAVDALISGEAKLQKDAAEIAGMTEVAFSRALRKPQVKQYIADELKRRLSTLGAITAANSLHELAQSAESEHVKADVSKHVLAIAGVQPAGERSRTGLEGFTFNITVNGQPARIGAQSVQTIEHEPQSQGDSGIREVARIPADEAGKGPGVDS